MASVAFKQEVMKLIDQLPETADWADLTERARYLAAVDRGIEAADRGDALRPMPTNSSATSRSKD